MSPRLLRTGVLALAIAFPTDLRAQPPASSPSPPSDPALPAELTPDELRAAIARRFADEPDVLTVVRAALEVAGLDRERIRARARRGRRSGLVPSLRLGATRQRGVDRSQTTTSTSDVDRDDSLRLEAALTFDLPRLVYGPDETTWSREERATSEAAAGLAREVVETYFKRQRLIIEIEILGESDALRLAELAETNALLQVFTDGNFFRMMVEPRARP